MIDFDDALDTVLRRSRPLPPVKVALANAAGWFTARAVTARFHSPRFDQSAMDGYAVRVADVAAATASAPVSLRVGGVLRAGSGRRPTLRAASAIRVYTGAPLPGAAEAVVMQEYCRAEADSVLVMRAVNPGENVRYRGEEYQRTERLLAAGTRITPPVLGLLATQGRAEVWVRESPRVSVIAVGDELVPAAEPLGPGLIHESNGPAFAAALGTIGIRDCRRVLVRDDESAIRRAVAMALRRSQVVITVAGVSVGDYDFVAAVTERLGVRREFWKIAVKPGKPVLFGTWRGDPKIGARRQRTLFFGIPGNPVSALVTFHLLIKPALLSMAGAARAVPDTVAARLTEPYRKNRGRRHFLRGRLDLSALPATVTPLAAQGSHMLGGLADADCLIDLPADATRLRAGQTVAVWPLHWDG